MVAARPSPVPVHCPSIVDTTGFLAGGACCLLENRPGPGRSGRHPMGDILRRLTPAERRVLAWVCAGAANKEIAAALGRSEATVKHQVSACLRKFGQPSRARLIASLR